MAQRANADNISRYSIACLQEHLSRIRNPRQSEQKYEPQTKIKLEQISIACKLWLHFFNKDIQYIGLHARRQKFWSALLSSINEHRFDSSEITNSSQANESISVSTSAVANGMQTYWTARASDRTGLGKAAHQQERARLKQETSFWISRPSLL